MTQGETRSKPKAIVSWSSGKDSAMALHRTIQSRKYEIACLLTTVSDAFHRVSMHGVREELLERQAEACGIELYKVRIPYPCPNSVYEEKMRETMLYWMERGVTHAVFGDLFLQDIRKYREEKLAPLNVTPVFPVWGTDTAALAKEMISSGFRAILSCVNPKKLDPKFAGREYNPSLLADLPPNVDPCGENGEFHTFVYDGPIFKQPIPIQVGERLMRDGFQFADIVPKS